MTNKDLAEAIRRITGIINVYEADYSPLEDSSPFKELIISGLICLYNTQLKK
jgi:hypothetical protein